MWGRRGACLGVSCQDDSWSATALWGMYAHVTKSALRWSRCSYRQKVALQLGMPIATDKYSLGVQRGWENRASQIVQPQPQRLKISTSSLPHPPFFLPSLPPASSLRFQIKVSRLNLSSTDSVPHTRNLTSLGNRYLPYKGH